MWSVIAECYLRNKHTHSKLCFLRHHPIFWLFISHRLAALSQIGIKFKFYFFVSWSTTLTLAGSVQTKGACLVPKRGINVMSGEVNRLLQLTSSAIVPLTYQVPRKVSFDTQCKFCHCCWVWIKEINVCVCVFFSKVFVFVQTYREFHADLFPDTNGSNPSMSFAQWMNGANVPLKKVSLDPSKSLGQSLQVSLDRSPSLREAFLGLESFFLSFKIIE